MKNIFLSLFLIGSCFISARGQLSSVYATANGAIDGYDPVAYFTDGKPVKGSDNFIHSWQDVDWHFTSKEHMDAFIAHPEKYAPQYGGYCAYGCAEGHKSPTKPETWTIVDNKLYLNYNKDVKKEWMKHRDEQIKKADNNWTTIKNKE